MARARPRGEGATSRTELGAPRGFGRLHGRDCNDGNADIKCHVLRSCIIDSSRAFLLAPRVLVLCKGCSPRGARPPRGAPRTRTRTRRGPAVAHQRRSRPRPPAPPRVEVKGNPARRRRRGQRRPRATQLGEWEGKRQREAGAVRGEVGARKERTIRGRGESLGGGASRIRGGASHWRAGPAIRGGASHRGRSEPPGGL